MKKIIYIMLIICVIQMWISSDKSKIIDEESFRFRIIANSNDKIDQLYKQEIKKDLESNIFGLLEESSSLEETKIILKENENVIKTTIEKYNIPYSIKYGKNYFPEKKLDGIIYKEGYYDSLVISLGKASGNNWWCVMYPPLCLLEKTGNNLEEVEYRSFFKEFIEKLTS